MLVFKERKITLVLPLAETIDLLCVALANNKYQQKDDWSFGLLKLEINRIERRVFNLALSRSFAVEWKNYKLIAISQRWADPWRHCIHFTLQSSDIPSLMYSRFFLFFS